MNLRKWWGLCGLVVLSLLLIGGGFGSAVAGPRSELVAPSSVRSQAQSVSVLINEVMPKADVGEYEWVELTTAADTFRVYLPVVLRACTGGTFAGSASSSSISLASDGMDLSGYQITDEDGNVFTIPAELPPVPPGAFVLIIFEEGVDDYDFSDNQAVLYTGGGLSGIFADAGDQVALYSGGSHSADTIVDFVAWTIEPQGDAANAAAAGIWQPDWFDTFESGFGDTSDADILEPNESLGRYPGSRGAMGPQALALYHDEQLTPGQTNPVPLPSFYTPENGAIVETEGFSVSWSPVPGATAYRFQLDDDLMFGSPLYDTIITESYYQPPTPLAEGTYYWRVKPLGGHGEEGAWLAPIEIGIVVFSTQVSAQAETVLGITPVRQNKDSRLICLDRCPEGDPTTNNAEDAWDAVAPCTVPPCADALKYEHGTMYCVVASIRMMASYYGGDLTMDRIAYHIAQEWTGNTHAGTNDNNPNNDLAHDNGWSYHDEEDEGISWALGTNLVATDGKPSFSDIKTWIDAGRPIMFRRPGHLMVMDGYREEDGDQYIHVLDPDQAPDCWRWQDYATQDIFGYWPGPVSAPGVRSDEASVSTDTDGDGIMDFDEIHRFPTSYTNPDSDDDWVRDKQDMREYVFDSLGAFSYRNADWDSDGDRKEVDCDNDNDGSPDGCEDVDGDGIFDLGETDNFDAGDSQDCVPTFEITYPTHGYTLNAGAYNNPDKILIHLRVDAPDCGSGLSLSPGDFDVTVGTEAAPDPIAGYSVGEEYWILVQAPGQLTADHYDLEVTYDSTLSDSEERAIYYLPRLVTDEVLVVDVSGSMSGYDKLTSAQNAARLFVDQWTTDDRIGTVAFSSTVSVPYPLEPITTLGTGGEQEAAKDEIDALTADGTTAMGSGLLEGQHQLDTRGDASHEHTMVLLGDGMENEPPYWTDASVHDTIVDAGTIVHVVGLGPPTAAWYHRLEDVADETGGEFWPVDETVTVSASDAGTATSSPFVSSLPNRLADAYKSAAEIVGRLQRLWEETGTLNVEEPRTVTYEVDVEKGLGEALFSVNWDDPDSRIVLSLTDPDGDAVTEKTPGVIRHTDRTHDQYRVQAPEGGKWLVKLSYERGKWEAEYLAILAAPSKTTMGFQLGLHPEDRVSGANLPLVAYLTDRKPIAGARVKVMISLPNNEYTERELFDDGEHGDGSANDGVYANTYKLSQPGVYRLKVRGEGEDNADQLFTRRLSRSFSVRPRVAYIYKDDLAAAHAFGALLENHGLAVDLLSIDAVVGTDVWVYDLIVVGADTGTGDEWVPAAVAAIAQSGSSVIGLGEGGYTLFGQLGLRIGSPWGWHGTEDSVQALNILHEIWSTPYPIALSRKKPVATLYERGSGYVAIHLPKPVSGVVPLGREIDDRDHYPLIKQDDRYLLWGFDDGPRAMTEGGWQVFVNTVWHMIP